MSDNYLRLVPAEPNFCPAEDAARAALATMSELFPAAKHVELEFCDEIRFFDAGQNTESVACPHCDAELSEWWGDAMDIAYVSKFADLSVRTPCCQRATSLNDLVYMWPVAFGRFALEAANPGRPTLSDEERAAVEQALGSQLRVVWQRL